MPCPPLPLPSQTNKARSFLIDTSAGTRHSLFHTTKIFNPHTGNLTKTAIPQTSRLVIAQKIRQLQCNIVPNIYQLPTCPLPSPYPLLTSSFYFPALWKGDGKEMERQRYGQGNSEIRTKQSDGIPGREHGGNDDFSAFSRRDFLFMDKNAYFCRDTQTWHINTAIPDTRYERRL